MGVETYSSVRAQLFGLCAVSFSTTSSLFPDDYDAVKLLRPAHSIFAADCMDLSFHLFSDAGWSVFDEQATTDSSLRAWHYLNQSGCGHCFFILADLMSAPERSRHKRDLSDVDKRGQFFPRVPVASC
ncbi:MAG: hypothetical protein ACREFE_20590, partial [Limisphaerales bacterium]